MAQNLEVSVSFSSGASKTYTFRNCKDASEISLSAVTSAWGNYFGNYLKPSADFSGSISHSITSANVVVTTSTPIAS